MNWTENKKIVQMATRTEPGKGEQSTLKLKLSKSASVKLDMEFKLKKIKDFLQRPSEARD